MGRFVKRPIEVEAFRWDGTGEVDGWPAWAAQAFVNLQLTFWEGFLWVRTLEGRMRAQPDDWIVRGVRGELYPVKPGIFDETYEAVGGADGQG